MCGSLSPATLPSKPPNGKLLEWATTSWWIRSLELCNSLQVRCEQQLNRKLIITRSLGRRGEERRDCRHDDVLNPRESIDTCMSPKFYLSFLAIVLQVWAFIQESSSYICVISSLNFSTHTHIPSTHRQVGEQTSEVNRRFMRVIEWLRTEKESSSVHKRNWEEDDETH